jgi:hypothetical protein
MRNIALLVAVTAIPAVIALGGAQVPQPYRAWLVAWALVGFPLTFAALAITRQLTDLRKAQLDASKRDGDRIGAAHPPAQAAPKPEGLRVVTQGEQIGSGRHIVR